MPIFLTLAVVAGVLIGANIFGGGKQKELSEVTFKLREILTYIDKDYVDEVDAEQLAEEAIESMLTQLDPHSTYIPARDQQLVSSQLEGDFEGIGVEFNIVRDTLVVVSPISGGPSDQAGVKAGDKIINVNDSAISEGGLTNREVFNLLRGPKGSEVKLGIRRDDGQKLIDFVIVRDKIPQYTVDIAYMVNEEIGYIKVNRFGANTYEEFVEALKGLKKQGMKKLVLDLRDNPGGYLDRAVNMADELIAGDGVIVSQSGKQKRYNAEYRARKKGIFEDGPLVVLINEGSASASEILSGAVQDHDRGLIVGRRSFGKGLVQYPFALSDGSELRLTISRYYTPSGRSIQKPYTPGEGEEYGNELMDRYEHGEFFHADSIHFDDSLKYETVGGRTVYGGGGIMPDVFVARDTALYTGYYTDLLYENVLREYALDYYDANKASLLKTGIQEFILKFQVSAQMLEEVNRLAVKQGIEYDESQFQRSRSLIENSIKAFVARSAFGTEGLYPVLNQQDEIFNESLKLFDEAQRVQKGRS